MTGDGVNDVILQLRMLGLRWGSGSEIAKDASDIILLDDNFTQHTSYGDARGQSDQANIRRMLFRCAPHQRRQLLTRLAQLLAFRYPLRRCKSVN